MEMESQKQIYTMVYSRYTATRTSSSPEGRIPILRKPTAPISTPVEITMMEIRAAPARNFPIITESR